MKNSFFYLARVGVMAGLALNLAACATSTGSTLGTGAGSTSGTTSTSTSTASSVIEAALPLIRTGAAVATGAVLDFSVQQASTRTRLANEMYAAASAVYSLSGGSFPSPGQLQTTITSFGGSETDASYAQFSSAIAGLYAAYYPKLASGDAKTAADVLNAVAGGIEDATQAYVTTPAAGSTTSAVFSARSAEVAADVSIGGANNVSGMPSFGPRSQVALGNARVFAKLDFARIADGRGNGRSETSRDEVRSQVQLGNEGTGGPLRGDCIPAAGAASADGDIGGYLGVALRAGNEEGIAR